MYVCTCHFEDTLQLKSKLPCIFYIVYLSVNIFPDAIDDLLQLAISMFVPPLPLIDNMPLTIDSGLSFHGTLWLLNILNCLFYQAQTLADSSVTCQKFTELQAQTIVTHSSCRIMRNLKIPSLYGPALRKIIPCHTRTRKQRRNEMMDNRIGFQDDLPI